MKQKKNRQSCNVFWSKIQALFNFASQKIQFLNPFLGKAIRENG